MKQKALLVLALLVVFASGFLLGRQFPAHHYEMAMRANPFFVLDTTTGRVCDDRQTGDPFAKFGGSAYQPPSGSGTSAKIPLSSLFNKGKAGGATTGNSPNGFFDKLRKQNPPSASGLPYCGN